MVQRARSEEQKLARKSAIISAAGRLFEKTGYQEIHMTAIAREARLAKGTLFFYFKTKEELFLALAREEMERWHQRINERLQDAAAGSGPRGIAETISESLSESPRLVRLTAILGTVLERNIDRGAALDFKAFAKRHLPSTAALLERSVPAFKPGDGARFYLYVIFLIVGIYPSAEPAPVVRSLQGEPGMEIFRVEFRRVLKEILDILIRGWR
jgi:AcrR family transcriptional regulator